MLNKYLKITWRSLKRNYTYVLINIFGLAIALACCITSYLNWEYNTKFDAYHADTENVYRINFVRITNDRPVNNGSCPLPLGEEIRTSIPQVKNVVRYSPIGGNIRIGNEVFRTSLSAVDVDFFETFHFPTIHGNTDAISDKKSILISSDLHQKHFPNLQNPIGQILTYIKEDSRLEFQVGGVFETPPKNTSFYEDAYILYDNVFDIEGWKEDNWSLFNSTFVSLHSSSDKTQVESQLEQFVAIQNKAKEDYKVKEYYLDPFVGMAVRAERNDTWNHWMRQSLPTSAAVAPGFMAALLLLIACFNFTNTSIAIANRRLKEIGIRKVLGSHRIQLIIQFLMENLVMVFVSLIIGLLISFFLVPAYSAMWPFLDIRLNLLENVDLLGFLGLLLIFTALVAGSYPALYISNFQPLTILRGTVKFSGTNPLTRVLLTAQFSISLLAIIAGFVFAQNANYQNEYDMGFDMSSTVSAYVENEQGYSKFRNELQGYDIFKEVAGSRHSWSSSWYTDPIKYKSSELDVSIFDVGAGYLSTTGATLLKGRDFFDNSLADSESSVIVNEELVRQMEWSEPIGERIILKDTIALNVIGVLKDVYFEGGLWDPMKPMLVRHADQTRYRFLTVKADADDVLEAKALMEEKWKSTFPDKLSSVTFMEEEKAEMALVNTNIKILFFFLGIVAVLLSAIGLFSLVSLNLVKQMREIGVRKVLGATVANITFKVSREFIIIITCAAILGSIGGYFLTDLLMSSIWTYYIPVDAVPFLISIGILFLIGIITIGGKVVKAASMNPAYILRDD